MEWLVIAICLGLNALLAAAEMAFVTLTRSQVKELAKSGRGSAAILLTLRENPERTLSVMQVGIGLVGALAAAVGGVEAHARLTPYIMVYFPLSPELAKTLAIAAIVIPLTFVNVIFAELVPKTLALRNPVKIALFSARWLMWFDKIFLPIVDFLEWTTKRVLSVLFPKSRSAQHIPSADTVELDQLSSQARQYVLNLVGLEKKRVRDIALP
jgi:putative hemolysin